MKPPNAGKGRKKGVPNKATANAREAIAAFVDGNVGKLQGWLDAIAEADGPKAAWECFKDVLEYHVPKLARTELTGAEGKPLGVQIVRYSDPTAEQLAAAQLPNESLAGPRTGSAPSSTMLAPPLR